MIRMKLSASLSETQMESPGLHSSLSSELSADTVNTLNKAMAAVTKQSASFDKTV